MATSASFLLASTDPFASNRRCAPSAASLLDSKSPVPSKWTEHSRATALAAANRARVRPHSDCLAVAIRVCIRPFVAVHRPCSPPAATPRDVSLRLSMTSRCDGSSTSFLSRNYLSTSHPAMSCAQGINASDLTAMAFSALPAGLTLAVPLARAGAAPITGDALPRSCVLSLEGSSSLTSAFSATAAGPRGSGYSWNTGTLPNVENAPLASCRTLSGGFRHSGQRTSVPRHLVTAPSPREGVRW